MARKVNNLEIIDLVNNSITVDLVNGVIDNSKLRNKKRAKKKNQKKSDETKIVVYYVDKGKEEGRLVTFEGSIPYSDMPLVLEAIFPAEEMLKDHLGYKLVNDYTEQRIKVSNTDDPTFVDDEQHVYDELGIQYLVTVQCPTVRLQDLNNFSKLFNSKKFSDVTLCVKDKTIYAHKNILANKSSVFEAKFDQDMFDKVEIKNLDYDTVCDFLYYIYAGKLKKDSMIDAFSRYLNLLVAADNYRVESLKERCEQKLPLLLRTENVLDCLLLANLHNAVHLKKEAIDFIVRNAEEVISLPSYKSFLEMHATLSIEFVRALVVKKRRTE